MSKSLPTIKRNDLTQVLQHEKKAMYWIVLVSIALLTVLTICTGLYELQPFGTIAPWLGSLSTFDILLGLDALAVVVLINLQWKTGPDFWYSATYGSAVAALIWTIARTIIIKLYLYQPNLYVRINGSGSLDPTPSIQERIFAGVAEQNFTIILVFLTIALWSTYSRLKATMTTQWSTQSVLVITSIFTLLNLIRIFTIIPYFDWLWIGLVIVDLGLMKIASHGPVKE